MWAGSLRLSETTVARNSSGTRWWIVLSWNSLTNSEGTGSSSAHLLPKARNYLVRGRLRSDQGQAANAVGVAQHRPLREKGSRRSTDDGRSLDAKRVHERIDICSVVVNRVTAFWLVRVPVPALAERESVILG